MWPKPNKPFNPIAAKTRLRANGGVRCGLMSSQYLPVEDSDAVGSYPAQVGAGGGYKGLLCVAVSMRMEVSSSKRNGAWQKL